MTRTAAEVEEEVVAQRDQLDRTVEALRDKMTPGQLLDEATRAMGGAGQQVLTKFVEQAKENPMPLAVMGLGLAWLMSSTPKTSPTSGYGTSAAAAYQQARAPEAGGPPENGAGDTVHAIAEKASKLMAGAGQKASEIAGGASHALSDAAASTGHVTQSVAAGLQGAVHGASDRASAIGGEAQRRVTDLFEPEPLIIGALGLFVGVALGASLPATPVEDELLGPMHDRLLEKGKDIATQTLGQASGAGKAAVDALKTELAAADLPGAVHDVAHAAAQAVKDALHEDEEKTPC